MILLQPKKVKRLLAISAGLPLLTTPKKKEDVLEITDAVASMYLSEEAKRARQVLIEKISSICYT